MDGPGFHVDVDKVEQAATGIKTSVDDQSNFELRGLGGNTELYGHGGIHDALMNFCVRWSDTLTDDAGAISDVLGRAAQAYRAVDAAAAGSLKADPGVQAVDDG